MRDRSRLRVVLDAGALADDRATAGIGRYARSLAAELAGRHELDIVVAKPLLRPPSEAWVVRFAWAQPVVGATALVHRAQLVHALASDPALLWPPGRQVVTLHDALPWTRPPGGRRLTPGYLEVQRRRLRRCAAVIVPSHAVARDAAAVLRLDESRIHVVPEGIDPVFGAAPRPADAAHRRAAGAPAGPFLLWVGSLRAHDPRKGLDTILSAVAACRHPDVPLVLAGARGAEGERLERLAREHGLQLILPGYVPDETLAALYRGATAVLFPSTEEGFGLPALEAMATGAPLIAASSPAIAELVQGSAILVEGGSVPALAAAIDRLLDDPAASARMRTAGPATAAPYTWARTADLTLEVYREVLEDR